MINATREAVGPRVATDNGNLKSNAKVRQFRMLRTCSYYLPKTKLREGNVFTPVYDFVHRGVSVQRRVSV